MPNLRDTTINLIEELLETEDLSEAATKKAELLLELLEDQRDSYGSRPWDEDE